MLNLHAAKLRFISEATVYKYCCRKYKLDLVIAGVVFNVTCIWNLSHKAGLYFTVVRNISVLGGTSTATRSCRDTGTAVIHLWLPGVVRRRPQRVTFAGSGGRRDTLRPSPLLLRPGAATTAAAAAAAAAELPRIIKLAVQQHQLLYSQCGN